MVHRARFRPIFLLAGAFVLLAPLSVASGLGLSEPAKYARLATTLLIVLTGAIGGGGLRMGGAGRAMTAFIAIFIVSGFWSDNPVYACLYKGMFGLSFLSGLVLVNSVRSVDEFKKGLRLLGFVAVFAAFVALLVFLRDPDASSSLERMSVFGLNANLLGEASALLWILCLYLATNHRSRFWLALMGLACAALGLIIIGTGSRGAALMALTGTMFLLLPMVQRPGRLAAVLLGVLVVVFLAFEVFDLSGGDRFVNEISKDTRTAVWARALRKQFMRQPLTGVGWLHYGDQWATLQNAYLQTLVESGLLGAGVLVVALVVTGSGVYRNYRRIRRDRLPRELLYLNLAFLAPVLMHGMAESSLFIGASLDSLFLGMGVGLVDRLLPLITATVSSNVRRASRAAPARTIGLSVSGLSGRRQIALPIPRGPGVAPTPGFPKPDS
ncbi:MAG: O-antigen ligase family protein [Planctomycetaceae bacterium]